MNILSLVKRNKILTDIGVYMFSSSLNQAIPFLLLPLLTIYLTPNDYGFINSFSAILVISNALVGGGLINNISKYFFIEDEAFMKKLMGNLYVFLFAAALLFFLAALIISIFVDIKIFPLKLFLAIPLLSFLFVSFEFLKESLKIRKQSVKFAVFTFSEMVMNISISLILIIGLLWNWKGRITGMVFSYFFFGILSLSYFIYKKRIRFSFNRKIMKKILDLSLPLLPSVISIIIIRRSGIIFVDAFSGKDVTGLYGIALNLSTIILFISMPFLNVWIPFIYKKLSDRDEQTFPELRNNLFLFTCFIFSVSLVFSLTAKFILTLMTTEAYSSAIIFIPWLAFGFAFWALYSMYMPFFIHFEKQKYLAWIAVSCALLNLVLNLILIDLLGAIGIAVAFFFSNLFIFLFVFIRVRTFTGLPVMPELKRLRSDIKKIFKQS